MKPQANLFNITYDNKIPLLCTFELTQKCNLRCKHCYLDINTGKEDLSTSRVKTILRQLKDAGTLYLVFTGGEPFLRKDLLELCNYARKLRFDLRIFTNGTLITEKTAKELSAMNLSGVELSLYGREKVHDSVTNVKGSFNKTIHAINILKKYRIHVTIKCPLIKTNFSEYKWLKSFAKKHGLSLKIDPTIAPKNSGEKSILKQRLSNLQLKQLYKDKDFGLPETIIDIMNINTDRLSCSAGHNLCAIDHKGNLYPCLQLLDKAGNLTTKSFYKIWWNSKLNKLRNTKLTIKKCSICNIQTHCQRCPGLALLEDGDLYGPSKIACQIAKITKVTKSTY